MLSPIKTDRLYMIIMDQITQMIDDENLGPGDRLPSERKIALELAVSRVSVRQAISALVNEGLLVVRPGGGTYVADTAGASGVVRNLSMHLAKGQINPAHIAEVRLLIEPEIARLCALNADSETCMKLENLLDRKRLADGRGASYDSMNDDFHMAIAEGSGNPVYAVLIKDIIGMMKNNMWRFSKQKSASRLEVLNLHLDQHEALYGAIAAHNGELAKEIMQQHIGSIENEMIKVFC